ncbi:hypothetical protein K505DRAFT_221470, partial [Melanomma pulvis-pyrius CBS 109.77]
CFPKRVTAAIEPCIVQTAWTDSSYNDTYHLYLENSWDKAMDKMPLTRRAWVVQELLLPPRVLYLNGRQLFWECYELAACETYPDGTPPNYRPRGVTKEAKWQAFISGRIQLDTTEEHSVSYLWAGIVAMYSKCELTYGTDKLVALSGVAKLMEQALDDEYCAGLWKSHLITELSWTGPSGIMNLPLRPSPYRAPSWSWASIDGYISVGDSYNKDPYKYLEALIDIIDCDIQTATADRTGAVVGGSLRVSGWLASIQLHADSKSGWRVFFDGKWWDFGGRFYISLDCSPSSLRMHCLPLFAYCTDSHRGNVYCLLLSPTGNANGQFQRIGVLYTDPGGLGIEDWTRFRGDIENEAWVQYEELCDNGKGIISIL